MMMDKNIGILCRMKPKVNPKYREATVFEGKNFKEAIFLM